MTVKVPIVTVEEEPTEVEEKPKRGRKPKGENEV